MDPEMVKWHGCMSFSDYNIGVAAMDNLKSLNQVRIPLPPSSFMLNNTFAPFPFSPPLSTAAVSTVFHFSGAGGAPEPLLSHCSEAAWQWASSSLLPESSLGVPCQARSRLREGDTACHHHCPQLSSTPPTAQLEWVGAVLGFSPLLGHPETMVAVDRGGRECEGRGHAAEHQR